MEVILGNHENKMQKFLRKERDNVPVHYLWCFTNLFKTTKVVSQDDFLAWIESLPMLLEREGVLLAHAGVNILNPTEPSEGCNVYGNLTPYDKRKSDWWKAYDGNQLVVWGHLIPPGRQPMYSSIPTPPTNLLSFGKTNDLRS